MATRSNTVAAQKRFAIKHGLTSSDSGGEQFRASLVKELHNRLNALKVVLAGEQRAPNWRDACDLLTEHH